MSRMSDTEGRLCRISQAMLYTHECSHCRQSDHLMVELIDGQVAVQPMPRVLIPAGPSAGFHQRTGAIVEGAAPKRKSRESSSEDRRRPRRGRSHRPAPSMAPSRQRSPRGRSLRMPTRSRSLSPHAAPILVTVDMMIANAPRYMADAHGEKKWKCTHCKHTGAREDSLWQHLSGSDCANKLPWELRQALDDYADKNTWNIPLRKYHHSSSLPENAWIAGRRFV